MLRAGLRVLINAERDMVVVGDAGDGHELLRQAGLCAPHVIILDLTMPKLGGLQALDRLREECPQARVLVLTMHSDPAYFRSSLAAGALGYVAKRAADQELLAGIRAVFRGHSYVDSHTTKIVMQDVVVDALARAGRGGRQLALQTLSRREREALTLLAQGHSNRGVAERLRVSVKTVETYRARLYAKLGVRSRAELLRFAVGMGLITPERLEDGSADG